MARPDRHLLSRRRFGGLLNFTSIPKVSVLQTAFANNSDQVTFANPTKAGSEVWIVGAHLDADAVSSFLPVGAVALGGIRTANVPRMQLAHRATPGGESTFGVVWALNSATRSMAFAIEIGGVLPGWGTNSDGSNLGPSTLYSLVGPGGGHGALGGISIAVAIVDAFPVNVALPVPLFRAGVDSGEAGIIGCNDSHNAAESPQLIVVYKIVSGVAAIKFPITGDANATYCYAVSATNTIP